MRVEGLASPAVSVLHARAADVVIGEGTSTVHEGAALRTPLVLMPGPIREAEMTAAGLAEAGAACMLTPAGTTPERVAEALRAATRSGVAREAALDIAYRLVTGGGGTTAAARLILRLIDNRAAGKLGTADQT